MFDAYAVAGDPPQKHRWHLGTCATKDEALSLVRDAIARGFVYGYLMQGHDVACYLIEESPTVTRISARRAAERTAAQRGDLVSRRPLLRIENC